MFDNEEFSGENKSNPKPNPHPKIKLTLTHLLKI